MARLSLSLLSFLSLAVLFSFSPLSLAKVVNVGNTKSKDGSIWTHMGVNYTSWTKQNPLKAGDIAVFKYARGKHQVSQLASLAAWKACNTKGMKVLGDDKAGVKGVSVTVTKSPKYIACMVFGHCEKGQKVILVGK